MSFEFLYDASGVKVYEGVTAAGFVYPAVAVHPTGVYVFLDEEPNEKAIEEKVYPLQKLLSCPRHKMSIYGTENGEWLFWNEWAGMLEAVFSLAEHVMEKIKSGVTCLDESHLKIAAEKIVFSGFSKTSDVREDSSGQKYVKKGAYWFPLSDENQEEAFKGALLLGWAGWLCFRKGKTAAGILYLLTAGLFGVGYVFDLISFLVGNARDGEGCYYRSLSNRRAAALKIAVAVPAAIILDFAYLRLWGALGSAVAAIFITLL